VDQEPRQRQRDGHQQPSAQPDGQENPHIQRPFFPGLQGGPNRLPADWPSFCCAAARSLAL